MVQQASPVPQSEFPHPSEAVKIGWTFFRENVGPVLVFAALMAAAAALAQPFLNRAADSNDTGTVIVNLVASFAILLVGVFFEMGLWRRALDYWDETHGLASPRSPGDAIRAAFAGAAPRLLPLTGWLVVLALALTAFIVVTFAIGDALGLVGLLLALIAIVVGAYVLDFFAAFFTVAAVDRPGNPIGRSFHVFKHHFWRIVGAYLLYGLIVVIGVLPFAVLATLLDDSPAADVIAGIGIVVIAVILRGAFTGARTAMYRAVYAPES